MNDGMWKLLKTVSWRALNGKSCDMRPCRRGKTEKSLVDYYDVDMYNDQRFWNFFGNTFFIIMRRLCRVASWLWSPWLSSSCQPHGLDIRCRTLLAHSQSVRPISFHWVSRRPSLSLLCRSGSPRRLFIKNSGAIPPTSPTSKSAPHHTKIHLFHHRAEVIVCD